MICPYCDQEMTRAGVSCVMGPEYRIRYTPHAGCAPMIERPSRAAPGQMLRHHQHAQNCHDCNCPPGGFHHPGCDAEHCPAGHVTMDGYPEQAISCGQCNECPSCGHSNNDHHDPCYVGDPRAGTERLVRFCEICDAECDGGAR